MEKFDCENIDSENFHATKTTVVRESYDENYGGENFSAVKVTGVRKGYDSGGSYVGKSFGCESYENKSYGGEIVK